MLGSAGERFLARADGDPEPVLWWRQRAAPGGVVGAIRVVRVVEVDRHIVAMAMRLEIAPRSIRLSSRGGVAERNEQIVGVVRRVQKHLGSLPIDAEAHHAVPLVNLL